MGPQLFSYGNLFTGLTGGLAGDASMGPQLFSYGNSDSLCSIYHTVVLQWGHNFSVMEIYDIHYPLNIKQQASMGPQLFSYGN